MLGTFPTFYRFKFTEEILERISSGIRIHKPDIIFPKLEYGPRDPFFMKKTENLPLALQGFEALKLIIDSTI